MDVILLHCCVKRCSAAKKKKKDIDVSDPVNLKNTEKVLNL